MLPDFVGIGAMRSGSTWLYANLKEHPDIWLPPVKELHYFDVQKNGPFFNWCYRVHLKARAAQRVKAVRNLAFGGQLLHWDLRYFLGARSDAWYQSLFRAGPGQIAGDITPGYSILPLDQIEQIAKLLPGLRIVFLMRNPIDRAWSNVVKNLSSEGRRVIDVSHDALFSMLESNPVRKKGDYVSILKNWESVFGATRVFKGYTDEIGASPESLLNRLCGFLGVEFGRDYVHVELMQRRIGASREQAMPPEVRLHLAKRYIRLLEELALRFGGYPAEWHDDALEALSQ